MHVSDAINSPCTLVIGGVYLLAAALWDLRYRRVPLWMCAVGVPVFLSCCYINKNALSMVSLSFLISVPIIAIALLIPGLMGIMDGIMLLFIGIGFGPIILTVCLCTALFTASLTGGILIIARGRKKEMVIPFIPFIFLGLIIGGTGW